MDLKKLDTGYGKNSKEKQKILTFLQKQNISNKNILDVGCGDGSFAFTLAEHFPNCKVFACDGDEKYITFAKQKYKLPNLTFEHKLIENININENKHDIIILSEVIEHLPNVNHCLKILNNISKKDCLLIVSTDNTFRRLFTHSLNYGILKKEINLNQWYIQNELYYEWSHHLYTFDIETLSTSLNIAGFKVFRYEFSNHLQFINSGMLHKIIFMLTLNFCLFREKIILYNKKK